MTLSRRDLLCGGAALTLAGAVSCKTIDQPTRVAPLGLADITVARELAQDYAGTLRRAAGMGYTHFGFRFAAYGQSASEPSPQDKAAMVRDAGLAVGVVRLSPLRPDYDRQIAAAAEIGARIVAMTVAPPFVSGAKLGVATRAAFDAWLPELAKLGAMCREARLVLAFHNHSWDLQPLEGESPLDIMARTISPRDLSFEVDLAWCWYAGVAPLDLLRRLGPRVVSMHLKDIDRAHGSSMTDHAVVIGRGEMGYASLLPRIRLLTSAIGFVEVDSPGDGLAAAGEGARFFRAHSR